MNIGDYVVVNKRVGVLIDILEKNNFIDEKPGYLIGFDINEYVFFNKYSYKRPLFIKNKEALTYVKHNYSRFKKNASKFKKCFKNNEPTEDFLKYLENKNISISIKKDKIILKWETDFGNFDKDSDSVKEVLNDEESIYSNSINNIRNKATNCRPEIRAFSYYNVRDKISINRKNHLNVIPIENNMFNIKFIGIIEIFFDKDFKKECLDSIRYKR